MGWAWIACAALGATSSQEVIEVDGERYLAPLDQTATSTPTDTADWLPPRADPNFGIDFGSGVGLLFPGSDVGPSTQPAFGVSLGLGYRFGPHFGLSAGPWMAIPFTASSGGSDNEISGVMLGLAAGPTFRVPLRPTVALVAGLGGTAAWGSVTGGEDFGGVGLNSRGGLELTLSRALAMTLGGQGGGLLTGSSAPAWMWVGVDVRLALFR